MLSFPAAITSTIPEFTARCIAASSVEPGADPPSDRLITRAPANRALSIPCAMAMSPKEQSLAVVQLPGSSARSMTMVESNATPIVF